VSTGCSKTLEEMTKQEKKEFFHSHIISLLERGNKPTLGYYGAGCVTSYHIIGRLPFNRHAIYSSGSVTVVKGFGPTGVPLWEAGVTYSDNSSCVPEVELVDAVKALIIRYRGTN
jgi:hypothetical protein